MNGNGQILFDEIQAKYDAKNHPEVKFYILYLFLF